MPSNAGALIERREYKYLIDEATATRVRELIRPFCELDAYAAQVPERRYTIDSLYFDTPAFALYQANQVELVDRYKLRVRGYPQAPEGPVFLEVKRRLNDVISKTRGAVARDEWVELVANPGVHLPASIRPKDRAAVERFLAIVHTRHAAPVTLVRYEREPWMSRVDDYARVTFDRRIRSQKMNALSFASDPRSWRPMDDAMTQKEGTASLTVLELKFTSAVPAWLMGVVRQLGLWRRSFCKYASSIVAWYGAPGDRRTPSLRGGLS